MIFQNKKAALGAEIILWFYRIFLLLVVAGSIVLVVTFVYSRPYDVRDIEASAISDRFVKCITTQMQDKLYLVEFNLNIDIFEKCIGFSAEQKKDFYISAVLYNSSQSKINELSWGNTDVLPLCAAMKKGTKITNFPVCRQYKYYLLNSTNTSFILDLNVDILKIEKNLM